MFERVGSFAERMATGVSRRAFLGRLGKGALATAGVVAGMFALGGEAKAIYFCPPPQSFCGWIISGTGTRPRCCQPGHCCSGPNGPYCC